MDTVFTIKELLELILNNIEYGITYKMARLVCVSWHTAAGNRVDEFSNHFLTLVTRYPHKFLGWDRLIHKNPNITRPLVEIFSDSIEIYAGLSSNKNISLTLVKESLQAPWNFSLLSSHPQLTLNFILSMFEDIYKWDWDILSQHKNITWQNIISHPELPWNWFYVSYNPNVTWEIFINDDHWPDKDGDEFSYNVNLFTQNNILKIVNKYPQKNGIGILYHQITKLRGI